MLRTIVISPLHMKKLI